MGAWRKSACLLMAALAACACNRSAGRPSNVAADQVKVEVSSVGLDNESGTPFVLLADQSSGRTLPIMIGESEARTIMLELHGIKAERPLTHDLLRSVIEQTGNHIDRVVIGDLRKETYYAVIYLDRGRYHVDSRPSDAIALALGAKAPIYVASRLLESSGPVRHRLPKVGRAIGLTAQELTPELAAAMGEQAYSGVLVSDVEPAAAPAIQRGDIVTAVGGNPVKTLKDFRQSTANLKSGDSVTVTLRRAGAAQSVTIKIPQLAEGNR
jgi:bifunctional DNase/RNase